jgi:phosphoribosylformylglycinamidine cyclo-ligase
MNRNSSSITYKDSGVNLEANATWVQRIRSAMQSTHGPQVLGRPGAFAGLFRLDKVRGGKSSYRRPALVGCADGVGSKLLLGIKAKRLRGLGVDLVAMNVNDLITCGAEPLFFLDYLAVHNLDPDALLEIVEGVAGGCREGGCALLGGETAEMPDLYRRGDFDLAGFAVGVVEESRVIDGSGVSPGDVLIGLPSSGVHSNGYSLVRKLVSRHRMRLTGYDSELGESPAEALLRPTRIYVRPVLELLRSYGNQKVVTGMAHITGGGLPENVARALGEKCDAVIESDSWQRPPVFGFLQGLGVEPDEMFRVFNMGIGYVVIVRSRYATGVQKRLADLGEAPVVIGRVERGHGGVILR